MDFKDIPTKRLEFIISKLQKACRDDIIEGSPHDKWVHMINKQLIVILKTEIAEREASK